MWTIAPNSQETFIGKSTEWWASRGSLSQYATSWNRLTDEDCLIGFFKNIPRFYGTKMMGMLISKQWRKLNDLDGTLYGSALRDKQKRNRNNINIRIAKLMRTFKLDFKNYTEPDR